MISCIKKGLNSNQLKLIAIVAMFIDHFAWAFMPFYSVSGQISHIIGRLTAPIMCFCLVEGYYHTRNINRYLIRMGIFSVISHFAFVYFNYGKFLVFDITSVIFSLFCALLSLRIFEGKLHPAAKMVLIMALGLISRHADWGHIPIVYALLLAVSRERDNTKSAQLLYFAIGCCAAFMTILYRNGGGLRPSLMVLGVFLSLIPISLYNGERGNKNAFSKWFFYIFYPLHLLILGYMKYNIY